MHLLGGRWVISRNRKQLIKGPESQNLWRAAEGEGLVWFNGGALQTGGTLGPGSTGAGMWRCRVLSPRRAPGKRNSRGCIAAFLILCQFIVTENNLYILINLKMYSPCIFIKTKCDNLVGEMAQPGKDLLLL